MGYVAVAVPASLTLIALDIQVGDAPCIDDLSIEGSMAPHAVLHDDLCTLVDRLDSLSLLSRDELVDVVHPVFTLEEVLSEDVVVRYVTVVTRGVAGVSTMHPRSIVRGHDVAVDAGRRIIP